MLFSLVLVLSKPLSVRARARREKSIAGANLELVKQGRLLPVAMKVLDRKRAAALQACELEVWLCGNGREDMVASLLSSLWDLIALLCIWGPPKSSQYYLYALLFSSGVK